jgi:hypothetical protein
VQGSGARPGRQSQTTLAAGGLDVVEEDEPTALVEVEIDVETVAGVEEQPAKRPATPAKKMPAALIDRLPALPRDRPRNEEEADFTAQDNHKAGGWSDVEPGDRRSKVAPELDRTPFRPPTLARR